MMALLLRREGIAPFGSPGVRPASRLISRPIDSWMGIFLPGDVRVGFVNTYITPDTRHGAIGTSMTLTARLVITALSMPTDIYITGNAWLPVDVGLAEFDFKVRSGQHAMRLAAEIKDGILDAVVYTAGEKIPLRLPVGEDLVLSGAMGTTTFNVPLLRPGQEIVVDAFDPMTLSMGKARIKCVGKETIEVAGEQVKTSHLTTTVSGMTSEVWVAEGDEVVRVETPFGFFLRKITPQEALSRLDAGESRDLLLAVAVDATGKKPFRGARRMTLRLSGVAPEKYPPTDETQTAVGNEYAIAMATEPGEVEAVDSALAEYLESDAFVQADHPKIKAVALEAVQDETNPWKRALRLYEWVYNNINKTPVASVPSALEVLETREGDCNEHTVLFAALARSVGIPTRLAIGLAWSDTLDGFYYHAWPEVYVGRWTWMDPTLGQRIADATHIKLLDGNIEAWPRLLPYLGSLQIHVLSIQ